MHLVRSRRVWLATATSLMLVSSLVSANDGMGAAIGSYFEGAFILAGIASLATFMARYRDDNPGTRRKAMVSGIGVFIVVVLVSWLSLFVMVHFHQ